MPTKIDSLTFPNSSGTTTTYDIDLPADATPSISSLTVTGTNGINSTKFVKYGGTAAQFLKADGSVDSTDYNNQDAFSYIAVDSVNIAANSAKDTLTLDSSNVTLTGDATNNKVTIGITSTNVVNALGYTPLNEANISLDDTVGSESITLEGDTVTIATRDTTQTISGTKTFENEIKVSYPTQSTVNPWSLRSWGSSGFDIVLNINNVNKGIKVDQSVLRPLQNNYDLGTSSYKWRNLYLAGEAHIGSHLYADNINADGNITVGGSYVSTPAVIGGTEAGDSLTLSNNDNQDTSITLGDTDISISGDISTVGDVEVDGSVSAVYGFYTEFSAGRGIHYGSSYIDVYDEVSAPSTSAKYSFPYTASGDYVLVTTIDLPKVKRYI